MSTSEDRIDVRGRGAGIQPANPYQPLEVVDDLEHVADDAEYLEQRARPTTVYLDDLSQSIVTRNDSPDIGFNYSVNPYRGCAHGCSYCYARPTHEYLGFSAGIDFETKVLVKRNAPELLRKWLARPRWRPEPICFSGVTDCYQPVERKLRLTRRCLEVSAQCRQPITIVTKNHLVTRDLDVLTELAAYGAVAVAVSVTTLDQRLTRVMEPRTSSPEARLRAMEQLAAAGIPTRVMIAPVIPGLNDSEIPAILRAARDAGATSAGYVLLRLPTTVSDVFLDWLATHRPHGASKVESFVRSTRAGKIYQAQFGERQRGVGTFAEAIAQSFKVFRRQYGLDTPQAPLNCGDFCPPAIDGQMRLF